MPTEIVELEDRRLKRLKPAQLARELMGLPAKRRMDLIVESPNAQAVVAALDANDFFHTVQEIGADDSLPLLALASIEQMNHLFDIEWWLRDTLEPAKALTWIERLWRAGGARLAEWISNADIELLVSLFQQWITVDTAPEDIDLVEAVEQLPPRTLDDFFFWESKYPQYDDLITHLLTIVFETSYGFFKELMNNVLHASAAEVEESAYKFHCARLMDRGIPDFYDAMEIYRSMRPDEFTVEKETRRADQNEPVPLFAMALLSEGDLFARIVSRIEDPALLETIQAEMAALANKVIVADRLAPDNAQALRRAVEKSLAYVNLGLELLSGADSEKAAEIVRCGFLEHLFRIAHTEVAAIRRRLRAIVQSGWLKQCPAGPRCLDGEWFEAAEELLAATPRVVKIRSGGNAAKEPLEFEFFRTPHDLARAARIVDVIGGAGRLHQLLGGASAWDPAQRLWTGGQVSAPEDITLGVLVLMAAANFLISGKWAAEPLSRAAWPEIFPLLKPSAVEGAVLDWIRRTVRGEKRKSFAGAYLIPILRDYESEMRPFSDQNPPETHMVKFFMFSEYP
ncbi:MAG TPA: DUF6178 family protein [Syntrophobacteraceae bacterium]|nr:DUF6178 family protein [Syntrophobacteraceae bacterium]